MTNTIKTNIPASTITTITNGTSIPTIGTGWDTMIYSSPTSYDFSNVYTVSTPNDLNGRTLDVQGDANFEGDVKIKGKSLTETLDNIEKRLAILHPNPKLEEKWERLKALGDMYRELEKEIIEKEGIWATLKK